MKSHNTLKHQKKELINLLNSLNKMKKLIESKKITYKQFRAFKGLLNSKVKWINAILTNKFEDVN